MIKMIIKVVQEFAEKVILDLGCPIYNLKIYSVYSSACVFHVS